MAGATMPPDVLNPELEVEVPVKHSGLLKRLAGGLFG
jgi:hypothetical protein